MSNVFLRQAKLDDLPRIIDIIDSAKKTLKDRGVDQWQQGYPNKEILEQDIQEGISFVLMLNGRVVGSAALIQQLMTMSYYLGYRDVRIDTHPDNLVMQHIITSNGFEEKGTITMDEDKGVRLAYQILLK